MQQYRCSRRRDGCQRGDLWPAGRARIHPGAGGRKGIRQLIDAAIQAPSAVNQQPWLFTVVRDSELLARISCEAKAHMLRTSPAALASHHFQHVLNDAKFDIFYGAPVLVVISAAAGPWAIEDCALAAENMMLAAHASGLGTCWIGFAQGWLGTSERHAI